jgi:lysophospholipid acyltransferase (LPLAT)-like uncharacterized protein
MTSKDAVVTGYRVRPATFPDGHWMNRYWGPLARGALALLGRFPFYRYVLRPHRDARETLASGEPAIFACTHQDLFDCYNGLPGLLPHRRLAAMASYSRDGALAVLGLMTRGFEVVRGSSSRGGGEGLVMLRSTLASGCSVVMAADGPKAPLGDVKAGSVLLAARAGVPILPVRAWGLARFRFHRAWSRTAISLPFLPVVVAVGAPIRIPADVEDTRPFRLAIARSIAELARWTSVWAHGPPVAPFRIAGT